MKTENKKSNIKNKILNSFEILREYIPIHTYNEEILQKIIQQLAETIGNSEREYIRLIDKEIYSNYLLQNHIKKRNDKTIFEILIHRGVLS
jgi:hypothetical protein